MAQGPNEQSILASGMTVMGWQTLHPGQLLGPDPEDIGQVTTDPYDGMYLEDVLTAQGYFEPTVLINGSYANKQVVEKATKAGFVPEPVIP